MTDDSLPYIYGLESPTRSLAASKADEESVIFYIGTQSLQSENQFIAITFDEDINSAIPAVYQHSGGEIWQILASPTDRQLVATLYHSYYNSKLSFNCSVWRLPILQDEYSGLTNESFSQSPSLVEQSSFQSGKDLKLVAGSWHPETNSKVAVFASESVYVWDIEQESQTKLADLSSRSHSIIYSGAWCPHRGASEIFVLSDSSVRILDSKSGLVTETLDGSHIPQIRDVDFNPFDEYSFVTCGDDCCIKFWDRRSLKEPLRKQREHSHWVWKVRYNLLHDELVLSASSDGHVLLSNFSSISSQSSMATVDESTDSDADTSILKVEHLKEGLLKRFEDHEDSVYGVEWSPANPWYFASLSFDGRLVINRVPEGISDAMTLK